MIVIFFRQNFTEDLQKETRADIKQEDIQPGGTC